MLTIKDEGIILQKTALPWENRAVFNPAVIVVGGLTHMFYRAMGENGVSAIGYCQIKDGRVAKRSRKPVLFPGEIYEKKGVEDPRITYLDGTYYLLYTAYDGVNALICYATSKDLVNFTKHGIISPQISYDRAEDIFRNAKVKGRYKLFETFYKEKWGKDVLLFEKDAALFPRKINGSYALMHRILPGIQIIFFKDFAELNTRYWEKYLNNLGDNIVLDPVFGFESWNIGAGCPPIETPSGWLIIYHAVEDTPGGRIYRATAALLELNNPLKVIGRLRRPLFSPKADWEKQGQVDNVVFPTGATIEGDRLVIYYGAADTLIAAKSLSLTQLLSQLT